jgi:NADH-quinone oxidoreductase subunit L
MSVLFVLIPLLPLLACLVLAVAGRRIGEASHRIAIPAVAASFALSLVAFVDVLREGPRTIELYRLLQTGALVVDFGLFVDQLAVLLLLLVTGVSAIVQVYSSRYMIGDPRYQRFFAVTALFTSAMVMLVMSRNLLMTYMCWEAMGICSYLLISHWAHRPAAGRAAMKAFLVNAVADLGLGCAVLLTFQVYGTLDIPTILDQAGRAAGETVNVLGWAGLEWAVPATTVIPLLLLVGAMGKSAQVPLHVWLPFAMEAPTPVSALIHAATMVNAGPFLLVRFSPMLLLAPFAMTVIAIVGATTAIFAALVSLAQTDIKKILAYSTMSHIGFMVMTCGVGAFGAAVFHLLAHGFLKAFLFLSAGNSLQATAAHSGQAAHAADTAAPLRPLAWGALLLACIPPAILFSGPYEALWALHGAPAARWTFRVLALAAVFFTAWYLVRLIHRSFSESFSLPGVTVRPRLFSPPHSLIVLAGALVVAGFFYGFPSWFAGFIAPALAQARQAEPSTVPAAGLPGGPLLPLVAAVSGWAFAVTLRRRPLLAAEGWRSALYVWFWNKLYFDEVYDALVVRPTLHLARGLAHWIEHGVVDRSLNLVVSGSAHTALWLWRVLEGRGLDLAVGSTATASMVAARWLWRVLEGRGIQGSVDRLSHQADAVGRFLQTRELHTLQEHLLLVVGGLAGLLALFYLVIHGG